MVVVSKKYEERRNTYVDGRPQPQAANGKAAALVTGHVIASIASEGKQMFSRIWNEEVHLVSD